MSGWPSTRRYARSLSEAFADERAHCIEYHPAPFRWLFDLLRACVCVATCAVIGWMAAQWLN